MLASLGSLCACTSPAMSGVVDTIPSRRPAPPPLTEGTPSTDPRQEPVPGVESSPEKTRHPRDRFLLRGGLQLFADFNTQIDVEASGLTTRTIELEDVLGLDKEVSSARVDADLRWGKTRRHHFLASYYTVDRSSTRTLQETVEWEDLVFEIGAEVSAFMDIDIIRAAYRYDVWQDRRNELGLSLGIHGMLVEIGLAGEAEISGGGGASFETSEKVSTELPLPVLGIHYEYMLARKFLFKFATEALYLEFDSYAGYLIDSQILVEWRFAQHFGLGVGYNRFAVNVEIDEDDWKGEFDYTYNGILLFLSAAI